MPAQDSLKVHLIGNRTTIASTAGTPTPVVDVDGEELRMLLGALLRQGILPNALDGTSNPTAWQVRQNTGTDMNIRVGSGVTQRDQFNLRGTFAGQGSYLVRLESTGLLVSVPATDASLPSRYGVYLFMDDVTYGGTAGRAAPSVQCIRGTPAASPVTPTPLSTWSASALLWEFQLPALAAAITNVILDGAGSIDQRVSAVHQVATDPLSIAVFL
jgi:hypothetical protein